MTDTQEPVTRSTLPVPLPRPRLASVRVVIATLSFVALLLAHAILGQALGIGARPGSIVIRLVVSSAVVVTVLALCVALQRGLDRRPVRELGLGLTVRGALQFLVGTVVVAGAVIVATAVAVLPGWASWAPAAAPGPWLAALPASLIAAYVAQGLPEEALFRGYVFATTRTMRRAVRFALTSCSFGLIHIISGNAASNWGERLLYVVMACAFGFACTALRSRTDNIWVAVGGHGGFHLGNFVAALFLTPTSHPGTWLCWSIFLMITGVGVLLVKKPRL